MTNLKKRIFHGSVAAGIAGSMILVPTISANAAELSQDNIKEISFVDQDGEKINGEVDQDKAVNGKLNIVIKAEFPDDSNPGDTISFSINKRLGLTTDNLTLTNEEGQKIADLTVLPVKDDDGEQKFVFTLREEARSLKNRGVTAKISTSSRPFDCVPRGEAVDKILKASYKGNDVPISTKVTVKGNQCSVNANPHPEGVDPIPHLECRYQFVSEYKENRVIQNENKKNVVSIRNFFVEDIFPGGPEPYLNKIRFDIDGSKSENKAKFEETRDMIEKRKHSLFTTTKLPSLNSPYEEADSENSKAYSPRFLVPSKTLFPSVETAQEIKSAIISDYGEDVYYNKGNAYGNLPIKDKEKIAEKSINAVSKWIGDHLTIGEYDDQAPKLFVEIDAAGLVAPVTADGEKISGKSKIHFKADKYSIYPIDFMAYAPYRGASNYDFNFNVSTDTEGYGGACNGSGSASIGKIEGAAYGEPFEETETPPEETETPPEETETPPEETETPPEETETPPEETETPKETETPSETETPPEEIETPSETETPKETETPSETKTPSETETPSKTEPTEENTPVDPGNNDNSDKKDNEPSEKKNQETSTVVVPETKKRDVEKTITNSSTMTEENEVDSGSKTITKVVPENSRSDSPVMGPKVDTGGTIEKSFFEKILSLFGIK